MSNIYIQEPPALGKVLLKTSVGDIDVELWTKEAPKACRNFIQLCLEGYYNGTIFHRVVPDFIVQGGDPRGDGTGGESIYGSTFKDEFHSRLRFNRRGLVAMANAGKDDNGSQFFFTLNTTPELQNKHTIFGKVSGETVFNMLKLADGLTDGDDRPLYPHKISSTEVLENPFDDIIPRVTVEKKKDSESSKEKKKKDKVGVKNFGLLSFGAEAEEEEDGAVVYSGKPKSTHDLLDDPKLSKKTAADLDIEEVSVTDHKNTLLAVNSIREKLQKKDKLDDKPKDPEDKSDSDDGEYYVGKDKEIERRKQTDAVRDEIKKMKKDMKPLKIVKDTAIENTDSHKEKKENELKVQYEEEQEKYKKLKQNIPKKGSERESFTLALLKKFQSKLSAVKEKAEENKEDASTSEADAIDNDDWLAHKLHFEDKGAVLAKDASTKGDDWFDIYDPRNPLNKRKREENKQPKNKFAKKDVL